MDEQKKNEQPTDEQYEEVASLLTDLFTSEAYQNASDEKKSEIMSRLSNGVNNVLGQNHIAPMLEQIAENESNTLNELAEWNTYAQILDPQTWEAFATVYDEHTHSEDWDGVPFPFACLDKFLRCAIICKMQFGECRDAINDFIDHHSAEKHVESILSYDNVQRVWQEMKDSPYLFTKTVAELREDWINELKKPNSQLTENVLEMIAQGNAALKEKGNRLRGDIHRGVYEYCGETDYDYAIVESVIDSKGSLIISEMWFKEICNAYATLEPNEESDRVVEAICRLLPRIYAYSEDFFNMHSDPQKAKEIYEIALQSRRSTKPMQPRLSKDVLPTDIPASFDPDADDFDPYADDFDPSVSDDAPTEVYPAPTKPQKSEKSAAVALLLMLFFGVFGGHNFYLGKIGKGILYLFTFGVFGFGLLYDLFTLIAGKATDGNGNLVSFK